MNGMNRFFLKEKIVDFEVYRNEECLNLNLKVVEET